ncbi:MAG: hypothetical protein ACI955_002282 [Zhongshania sp.]|jgi:hypothetical protein
MYFEAVHTYNKSQHSAASLPGQATLRFACSCARRYEYF